ncbi:CBS domain-containing protein [Actinokineospora inagensis]|uniref:CBS domain-containing protein n=1 Tax=Actinokineospora inagensis TaxID=103730 RepID=UPI0003FFC9F3|nr:CBS domain-containing protein [Actinokineospora inagensis]
MRACDIMTSPVITVSADTSVKDAADLLATHGFTALPVVDDERLIGIVTEADIVRGRFPRAPRYRHPGTTPTAPTTVGGVMTTPVVAMGPGTDIADLVTTMLDGGLRSIPIVSGSRPTGIVTRGDLVRTLARDDTTIAADIRHHLEMYGGPARWTVTVHDGAARITDTMNDPTDRHVAEVLATAIPG